MARRPPVLPDHSLEAKWYSDDPRYSVPPPSIRPSPPPIGHPVWSVVTGGVAGALGGFMTLLSAQFALFVSHSSIDLVAMSRSLATRVARGHGFPLAAFVMPVLGGALLGAVLGYLSRRLLRVLPRLLFFGLSLPIAWMFVYAIVMRRVAPEAAAAVPFGPLALGTFVYGTFIAVVAPIRLR